MQKNNELLIFQWKNWEIILKEDVKNETIWANLNQISELFDRDKSVISRHIKNIFTTWELTKKWTVAKIATVQKEWNKMVNRDIEFFNLDMIISIWYKVDSIKATEFRKWSTKILKEHITSWFTINKNQISKNYENFIKQVEEVKKLLPEKIENNEVLELVKIFANTWFNLDSFDKWDLPKEWFTKKDFEISSEILYKDLEDFKENLLWKWQATELFAQEKKEWNLKWILWNIFQSFWWQDLYETIEEKASNLLYFVIKNHPFNDWNKRTWAFCFIWFLQKMWYKLKDKISPEFLTTLTLLIAQSNPDEKDRLIWLIILILKK